ncbi:NPCBM/NEW2 domain-containing protein [Singulisphaera sp. PoT]|uniref:NPCBM/NEW2 domain-containing protein n=1 Tax=Singulisphaera sp. PoT TaxID=3411797 RepID=UPI003BF5A7BA
MYGATLLMIGLLGAAGPNEYSRSLASKNLDQATLDAEGYGEKKALKREDDGLRITLAPGEAETGWKTPQQLRIGGDFKITANLLIKTLPKPAQEDGVAVGLAIAFQDITQPDLALVRVREPKGAEVYRSVDKGLPNPMMMMQPQFQMMGMFGQPGAPPAKPPRRTFPAAGDAVRLEISREGMNIRLEVLDNVGGRTRYLGQLPLGVNDVASIKVFVANRNGAEAVNVLLRDLAIHADRLTGLGTNVRTVYGNVVYAEPTSIEKGILIVGGQPKAPPAETPKPQDGKTPATPGDKPKPGEPEKKDEAKPAEPAKAAAQLAPAAPAVAVVAVAAPAPAAPAAPGNVVVVAAVPAGGPVVMATPAPAAAPAAPATPGAPAQPNAAAPAEPKAKIPLDELESIRFERTPMMSGRFVGQVNLDLTMPNPNAKKEEPKKDQPTPKPDEAKKDEKKDEPAAKTDDSKKEEPKKDQPEAKKDEAKKDDAKKDEVKKDETKKDEKKDEAKKGEEKKDDAKKEEPKKEAPAEKKKDAPNDALAPPPGTTVNKVPRVYPKKNGIRDLDLFVVGLRPAAIKQVMVTCQTDKGPASWRLDTTDSQDWPLVVRRAGMESFADIYVEPPQGDCFQKDFSVNITYEDGQMGTASIKSTEHTDANLAVDPKAPVPSLPDAWVYLTGDEKFFGKIAGITEDKLQITTPAQDKLDVPLARVVGIHFALLDRKETAEAFAKRLKARVSEDLLLAKSKNGEVVAIAGVLEKTENDKLHFLFQNKSRTLPLKSVEGLVMATRPDLKEPDAVRSTFTLPNGVVLSGRWKDLDTANWKIEMPWGQELKIPATDVQEVRFHGGIVTYLSDLIPSKVEETPFFARRIPYRRDKNLLGEPLKMKGQAYDRGVAVHSKTVLTYDLNRRYNTFESLVGFDDAALSKGRVECHVFADDKEVYANADLRADGAPVPLKLSVAGAEQLRLVIDFGQGQDTGDRVIWANARLYRQPAQDAKKAEAGSPDKEPAKLAERRGNP